MTFYSAGPVLFSGKSAVTTSRGPNDPEVGARMVDGDEEYIYVYNTGADAQIPPGYGAIVSAVTGYSVTVSSTTSIDFLVGVCKNATITTGAYGWLVTRGFTAVKMSADYSGAAGSLLSLGTDGKFDKMSNTTGNLNNCSGKLMEAVASGASGQAFICV